MEMNMDYKEFRDRRKKKKKVPFIPVAIISFLISFLVYVFFFTEFRLGWLKPVRIRYDTYTIDVSSLGDEKISQIEEVVGEMMFENRQRFKIVEKNPDIKLDINATSSFGDSDVWRSVFVPVVDMYSHTRDISLEESCFVLGDDLDEFEDTFKDGGYDVYVGQKDGCYALKNVNDITDEDQVVSIDGKYFFDTGESGFVGLVATSDVKESVPDFIKDVLNITLGRVFTDSIDISEYSGSSIAKIRMTGVTAISRGLAVLTDRSGNPAYAAEKIYTFLEDADLTHTSNEVSFIGDCTSYSGMRFCGRASYIEALVKSGIDIVELTGNHNNDYGYEGNKGSINLLIEKGMDHFGGGLDKEDAAKILYKDVDGSRIAFVGYNYYDTMLNSGAIATDSHAGANSFSLEKVESDINEARENEADIVIVTFQFTECYSYPSSDVIFPVCYKPIANQQSTFESAIDLGADVVIGTQAHQPQTYARYNDKWIFYGLGNLFFDQDNWIGTRQGLIPTFYIKDGELIQVTTTATMYGTDFQTRLATDSEAEVLYNQLDIARKTL